MNTFYYYRIIWRKSLRVLPRLLLTLLITAALLFGTAFLLSRSEAAPSVLPKIRVAIVVDGNDFATKLTVSMVENVDAVSAITEFVYLSDSETMDGLKDGSVQAAIYLPKNVYNDINSGVNTPITIKVSSQASLGTQMFQDLVSSAAAMLQVGEATGYTLYEVGSNYETEISPQKMLDGTAQDFISFALERGKTWNYTTISTLGDISTEQFTLVTALIAVLLVLVGASFHVLYEKDTRTVEQGLRRMGITYPDQTLSRMAALTVLFWLLQSIVLFAIGHWTELLTFSPKMLLALLPLAFSEAALVHLLHVLCSGVSGSLLYLLTGLLLLLIGGGLFPAIYLPGGIAALADYLPIHLWQKTLYEVLWTGLSPATIAWLFVTGILFSVTATVGYRIYE